MARVDGPAHARHAGTHATRATVIVGAGRPVVAGPAIVARNSCARPIGRVAYAHDARTVQVAARTGHPALATAIITACLRPVAGVAVGAIAVFKAVAGRSIRSATTCPIVTTVGTACTPVVTQSRRTATDAGVTPVLDRTRTPVVTHDAVLGQHRLAQATGRIAHIRHRTDTGRRTRLRDAGGAETAAAPIIGRATIAIVTGTVVGQDPRGTFTRRSVADALGTGPIEVRTIHGLPRDATHGRVAGFDPVAGIAVIAAPHRSKACSRTTRVGHGAGVPVITRIALGTAGRLDVRVDAAIGFCTNIIATRNLGVELWRRVGLGIEHCCIKNGGDNVFIRGCRVVAGGSEYHQPQ